jgi:UDP-4-amino-4,6-dideoxy-N-acetyl-beta-L-altrosamine transaminase
MKMIPYSTQEIDESDIRAVVKTLKSAWLTQGPAVERFEKALAERVGAKYCVAFNSGTAALHAAYFAAGAEQGDEVIVPSLTFAATANAALYLGAKPVFADSNLCTGNLSPEEAEKKITKKTKVIVPVDYAGRPADLTAFRRLARKHKLVLVEDAAQALGAIHRGRKVGSIADMTVFSFHPVKSITTAEGGAVATSEAEFDQQLRLFRSHGITKEPALFSYASPGAWYMEMRALGYNYRMPDLLAALGESQLKRLDQFVAKRLTAARRYEALLKDIPHLILPPAEHSGERSAWHLYPVRLEPDSAHFRDEVFAKMREASIGVQVHHIPVYLHPYYEWAGYKRGLCPIAEAFVASEISVPLFPNITEKQQRYIAATLRQILHSLS